MRQNQITARLPRLLLVTCLAAGLGGCKNNPYTITFNEKVVYSPSEAIRNAVFKDPGLQACLNDVLNADPEQKMEELKLLACTDAEIRTLEGIDALPALEQLELSSNRIDNLSPLSSLRNLRILAIRDNRLSNIGPLGSLPLLRFVSLQGNDSIPCRQLDQLEARLGNTLNRPQSCIR